MSKDKEGKYSKIWHSMHGPDSASLYGIRKDTGKQERIRAAGTHSYGRDPEGGKKRLDALVDKYKDRHGLKEHHGAHWGDGKGNHNGDTK